MGRLLSVDYGAKRCGIAVTDILKISINPIATVESAALTDYLKEYIAVEEVEKLLIGWPRHKDGNPTHLTPKITVFLATFAKLFPQIEIVKIDESYSSSEAKQIIYDSGAKKKKRRDKALVDQISAVIIIKRYLDSL